MNKVQGKSLKQNFFVYMLRNLMMMVTPIIIFPYASRVLGVDGVGKVQFAQTTATYFELIAQFGIKSYAIREGVKIRDDREKFGKFITELFIINICTDAVAVITYLAAVFHAGSLQSYKGLLMIFLLEVIFSGLSFEWFYSILEDYVYITIRTTVFQMLSLLTMLVFAHKETDLSVYAIALVLPYVGDSITNIFHSRKLVKLFGYKNYALKKHAKAMFFIFSIILSTSLYTMMDTTMLGRMQGDTATGLYSAASKLKRLSV
ncbi:MAG: oligosaccharide flippase family protein [Lachnospiraceae bacterium]|nr:oligosaccharide flippase family protein [Lachnospiraceae bacterium]